MIKIAIVDDEQLHRENLLNYLNEYYVSAEQTISLFDSGKALLDADIKQFDIIFLGIDMPDLDGLSVANKIMETHGSVVLIFVSSNLSFITKALNCNAFSFVSKPIDKVDLFEVLNRAKRLIFNNNQLITLKKASKQISIVINKITYVEVYGKECVVHMCDGTEIKVNERLCAILELLSEYGFAMCNRSYIVNLYYVNAINVDAVQIKNSNDSIPVGRNYFQSFKKSLNRFKWSIK